MSISDEEGLLLLALSCKRKRRRWWMDEINEKKESLGISFFSQGFVLQVTCIVQEHVPPTLFQLIFE
jgi:hypothetical protein